MLHPSSSKLYLGFIQPNTSCVYSQHILRLCPTFENPGEVEIVGVLSLVTTVEKK